MREVKNPAHGLIELAITLVNQREIAVQTGTARLLIRRSRPAAAGWGLTT